MPVRARGTLLVAVALLVAACGGTGDSGSPSAEPAVRDDPGFRMVADNGCLGCHALHGQGAGGSGGDLTGIGARLSAEEIRRRLLDPPSPMPPFTSLPEADLDALVDYLASLR